MEFNQVRMTAADTALMSILDWIIAERPFSCKAIGETKRPLVLVRVGDAVVAERPFARP